MNSRFKTLAAGVMLAGALGVTNQAQAFTIDTFDSAGQSVSYTGVESFPISNTTASGVSIGGSRQISIDTAAGGGVNTNVDSFNSNAFSVNNNTGATSTSSVLWNANGVGLGGLDLTDGGASTALLLAITFIDQGNVTIQFDVTETAAAGGSTASLTLSGLGLGTKTFLFSSFSNFASVDFTQVNSIKMTVNAGLASDLTLDLVETNVNIPEPSSLVLMGLGLVGFSTFRKRKSA